MRSPFQRYYQVKVRVQKLDVGIDDLFGDSYSYPGQAPETVSLRSHYTLEIGKSYRIPLWTDDTFA